MALLICVGIAVVLMGLFMLTPAGKAAYRESMANQQGKPQRKIDKREKKMATFSKVAADGACPRCGSTQFTAKRSMKGKMAAGILATKTQVRCVGCGQTYRRG